MTAWKTVARRRVATFGRFLGLEARRVVTPSGVEIDEWSWIDTPDYVNVFAVTADERVVALDVEKYAVGASSLALPGGFVEPGESPPDAARRELREETGYVSSDWTALGRYVVDANRGAGTAWFFLARRAEPGADRIQDDLESPQVRLAALPEIDAALAENRFLALPWAACAALAMAELRRQVLRP